MAMMLGAWGGSSAGRASRSQCEGREFDPPPLHQSTNRKPAFKAGFLFFGCVARSRRGLRNPDVTSIEAGSAATRLRSPPRRLSPCIRLLLVTLTPRDSAALESWQPRRVWAGSARILDSIASDSILGAACRRFFGRCRMRSHTGHQRRARPSPAAIGKRCSAWRLPRLRVAPWRGLPGQVPDDSLLHMAPPARFERTTFPLGGGRSIQLSYGGCGRGFCHASGRDGGPRGGGPWGL